MNSIIDNFVEDFRGKLPQYNEMTYKQDVSADIQEFILIQENGGSFDETIVRSDFDIDITIQMRDDESARKIALDILSVYKQNYGCDLVGSQSVIRTAVIRAKTFQQALGNVGNGLYQYLIPYEVTL